MGVQAKKHAVVEIKQCVACGCCVFTCPLSAIQIHHGCYAVVDDQKCVGCGKCSKACPASIIQIEVRG